MSTTTPSAPNTTRGNRVEYVLAELRCAALRARLAACDIDAIGVALRGGMVDPERALVWLHDRDALDYVAPAGGLP